MYSSASHVENVIKYLSLSFRAVAITNYSTAKVRSYITRLFIICISFNFINHEQLAQCYQDER